MIGKKTGRVLKHALRCSGCRICDRAKERDVVPKVHNCKKNWTGSAKAMEPDMVVEMLRYIHEQNIPIAEVAGDDDSVGFDRAKKIITDSSMVKTSDKNHVKQNMAKHLYSLKPKHKELTEMVINSARKNFNYLLAQKAGDADGIEKGLKGLTAHMFGDHTLCEENWCGYLQDKDKYKHQNLPHGRDLTSQSLKSDMECLFNEKLASNSKKLSNLGSTQANESLNNLIALKAPKAKHYSSSSSLSYRISSAVLQKNEGFDYVAEVYIYKVNHNSVQINMFKVKEDCKCLYIFIT